MNHLTNEQRRTVIGEMLRASVHAATEVREKIMAFHFEEARRDAVKLYEIGRQIEQTCAEAGHASQ